MFVTMSLRLFISVNLILWTMALTGLDDRDFKDSALWLTFHNLRISFIFGLWVYLSMEITATR